MTDIVRISPSQIKVWRLCNRKWAFRRIDRIEEPTTVKQEQGSAWHGEAESWLKHGEKPGPVVAQGIRPGMMPAPGPHLLVEKEFEISIADTNILLIGFIDCVVPPDLVGETPTVNDHKFTSDLKWAMTEEELAADAQGIIYSLWAMNWYKTDVASARWLYYAASNPKKGPRKPKGVRVVEHTFDRSTDEWQQNWQDLMTDVTEMAAARRSWKSANDDAPSNTNSCTAYGGCFYRDVCKVEPADVLASHIAQFDRARGRPSLPITSQCDTIPEQPKETPMANLFDNLKQMKATADADGDALSQKPANGDEGVMGRLQGMADKQGINPPPHPATEVDEDTMRAMRAKEDAAAARDVAGCDDVGVDYDKMKVAELRKLYEERKGVKPPTSWLKPGLIEALRETEAGAKAPQPAPSGPKPETPAAPPQKKTQQTVESGASQGNAVLTDGSGLMVLFDCALRKAPHGNGQASTINLSDWIRPVVDAVAKENGVEHFGLIDFAKGGPMLAAKVERYIEAHRPTGVILVDSYSLEGKAVKDVLIRHAEIVVQGTR